MEWEKIATENVSTQKFSTQWNNLKEKKKKNL